ncbi:ribosome maturation factor RimP [Lentibacillus halophilus]|uniref:Ribosome maturation factor RimP n=1 Tax=Lentibacillus halophilus TaxID=295065 RepID=A0ABN0ZF34_9BACI
MSSHVIKTTRELATPILEEKGLELVDIEYVKEGKNWFLRVYIDKDGGVDINECGIVSEQLSEKLDEIDPIEGSYFLEVSSPGVERPLKSKDDFQKNIGNNVYVKLYAPIDGDKEHQGILKTFDGETASIEYKIKTRTKIAEIPYDKIAKARLAVTL